MLLSMRPNVNVIDSFPLLVADDAIRLVIVDQLRWAGTRQIEFKPDQLCISASTGRLYHPLPSPFERPDNSTVPPHVYTHGLIKSSLVLSELANDLGHDTFQWRGETFPLVQLP